MSRLFILTLNWNGEEKLKKLAPSLTNCLSDIDFEWYVKDNASKDGSIDYLNSLNNDKIKVIKYKDNSQNFSAGMNYLFNEIKPKDNDLILLLNNDVVFNDSSSIKKMLSIIKNDPKVGVVGAKLLFSNTNLLQHAGVVIHDRIKMPLHFRSNENDDANSSANRLFQIVTGAVLLTKAEYFRQVCTTNSSGLNGMDEQFHWAFDDVDLCLFINIVLKKKVVYCGETNIFHEESASLKKNPVNKMFMNHNVNLLQKKWLNKWSFDHPRYLKDVKHNLYK
jgi:GT2 family glycosyltransferase